MRETYKYICLYISVFILIVISFFTLPFHIDEMFVEFVSGGISGDTLKCIEENFEVQMKNKFKKSTALFNMYYLKTLYYTKKLKVSKRLQ